MTSRRTGGPAWTAVGESWPHVNEDGYSYPIQAMVAGGHIIDAVYEEDYGEPIFWIKGQIHFSKITNPLFWRYIYFTPEEKK